MDKFKKQLTIEEVENAALDFFPLLEVIRRGMPKDSTMEDTLKVMESVCKLAMKQRMQKEEEDEDKFGFFKKGYDPEDEPVVEE